MRSTLLLFALCVSCVLNSQESLYQKFLNLDIYAKNSSLNYGDTIRDSVLDVKLRRIEIKNEEYSDFYFLSGVDSKNTIKITTFTYYLNGKQYLFKKNQYYETEKIEKQLFYLSVYDTINDALMILRIKNNYVVSFSLYSKGVGDHWSSSYYFLLRYQDDYYKTHIDYFLKHMENWNTLHTGKSPRYKFYSEVGPSVTTEYIDYLIWQY